jgi:hypothetical protein
MSEGNEEKVNQVDVLCEEVNVGDYTIRPWSIFDLKKLLPVFSLVYAELKTKNIDLANWQKDLPGILPVLIPVLPDVLAITLKKPIEEIEKIPAGMDMKILFAIVQANMTYLKNSLTRSREMIVQMGRN